MQKTSSFDLLANGCVYSRNPSSTCSALSFSVISLNVSAACGSGLPVNILAIATAGIRNAKINTAYCTTCVQVMPFMPPRTAKHATITIPTTTPCQTGTSRKRPNTIPTPRIWPATYVSETKIAQIAATTRAVSL